MVSANIVFNKSMLINLYTFQYDEVFLFEISCFVTQFLLFMRLILSLMC